MYKTKVLLMLVSIFLMSTAYSGSPKLKKAEPNEEHKKDLPNPNALVGAAAVVLNQVSNPIDTPQPRLTVMYYESPCGSAQSPTMVSPFPSPASSVSTSPSSSTDFPWMP